MLRQSSENGCHPPLQSEIEPPFRFKQLILCVFNFLIFKLNYFVVSTSYHRVAFATSRFSSLNVLS